MVVLSRLNFGKQTPILTDYTEGFARGTWNSTSKWRKRLQ